jgi:hypothetical protein
MGSKQSIRVPKFAEEEYLQGPAKFTESLWRPQAVPTTMVRLNIKKNRDDYKVDEDSVEPVLLCPLPFEKGGQRNAFHLVPARDARRFRPGKLRDLCKDSASSHAVMKETRWQGKDPDAWMRANICELRATNLASDLAQKFNHTLRSAVLASAAENSLLLTGEAPKVSIIQFEIFKLRWNVQNVDRYVCVERFLDGEYVKHNANNGYVNKESAESHTWEGMLPQAFSHWSYEDSLSKGELPCLICDIVSLQPICQLLVMSTCRSCF